MTRLRSSSRSFARNATLRAELSARYPDVTFTRIAGGPRRRRAGRAAARARSRDRRARAHRRCRAGAGAGAEGHQQIRRRPRRRRLEAIARRGIKLAWTGGVNRRSVSELTLAFAIALLHRVPEADVALRRGEWQKLVGRQLTGRTFGIIGCGFVGQDLVRLLAPFECRVLAHDIRDYPDFYRAHRVTPVSLAELLARIRHRVAARAARSHDERHDRRGASWR